jgi:hypothetical protein
LREDEVANLSEDYPALVAEFVGDIVAELNEATVWSANDHELTISVVAGTIQYSLTGTTHESALLYTPDGMPQAWIFDDSGDTDGEPMFYLDPTEYQRRFQVDRGLENDKPQWFTIEKDVTNDLLVLKLWPKPSAAKYIRIRFNTPPAELDSATDASTEIKLPARLVRLGALMLATEERGDEMGELAARFEQRYLNAKAAAIENEIQHRERAGVYDWVRN